jgi:hypothetical protein
MRVAESLIIPDEVERARQAGELVIFAGAGVSVDPPASMPDFVTLARRIAEGRIGWDDRHRDRLDRYLGDAERQGLDVQTRARNELRPNGRTHTRMHEDLLGIFEVPERIRLITTNFEHFFDSAAAAVYSGHGIRKFLGPALPPGRDFTGMVQLHGSLSQSDYRLVLTDSDFAAAYMADGWATRFLIGVFAERTVLFVGYGLNDPVLQYLIRAIPSTGRWFAFTHDTERLRWEDMRIQPIAFQPAAGGRVFGDLHDGMQRWREYAQASAADHEQSLRELIKEGPPKSLIPEDYVRERLKTTNGRVTFWQHANTPEWFTWVADRDYLDSLTKEDDRNPDLFGWSTWALEKHFGGTRPSLLEFLRRRPFTPNRLFARALVWHLWRNISTMDRAVVRQSVVWLCNQARILADAGRDHAWLVEGLVAGSCCEEALLLLRALTRLRLADPERLHLAYEDTGHAEGEQLPWMSLRVGIWPGTSDLHHYLESHGNVLGASRPQALLRLGIERIREAYQILALAGSTDRSFDWLSYSRVSVAPSDQDRMGDLSDILVLMVRHALDGLRESRPNLLLEFAQVHSRDECGLLRRLALYAFARHPTLDADALLDQARSEGWPRDHWLRPELYLLLRAHYQRASEDAKRRFVADLQSDEWWGPDDE